MNKFDAAANIAFFLLERTGSVLGQWSGYLSASEQRGLFGAFLGKGKLHIDGELETVEHVVKRCFGLDYETTFSATLAGFDTALEKEAAIKADAKARRAAHAARIAAKFTPISG